MATWTKVVTESSSGTIAQATTGNAATATTATTVSDNAITLAKLAGIARGKLIYGDASGDPAVLAAGSNGQVLKSDGTDIAWAADTDTGDVNQNAWTTLTVPAGTTSQTASSTTDSLGITAAGGMTITGGTDTIQFSSADTNTNQLTTFTLAATTAGTSTTVNHGDTITIAAGAGITTTGTSDGVVTIANTETNTDVSVSKDNLEATLALMDTNYTIGSGSSIDGTISGDLTVTGDLTVSGATTTINTATLQVEDKLIKLADVATPTLTTADGAGIQVEASATEADWPEIKWAKSKGAGNTTGAGTANGLTGWTVANMHTANPVDVAIAVMDFKSDAGAPANNSAGIGSFSYNSNDTELYIRTA